MLLAEVHQLVGEVDGVDPSCRDREVLCGALADVARLRSWLESRHLAMANQLAKVVADLEPVMTDATRISRREAKRTIARAETVEAMPLLSEALMSGDISGAHIDVIGRALRGLEPPEREALAERAAWLTEQATRASVDELDRLVKAEVRRVQADDGLSRLERQRRAARVRTWIDDDGMWCLHGRFDPLTGLRLSRQIAATMDRLFAERSPVDAPTHPTERQHYLRAQAVVALLDGDTADLGRSEIVVVVDTTASDSPMVDWGLPVELPHQLLADLFQVTKAWPVVVRNGAILHAPGRLDLGRTTRIANRAQRRALRAVYPTCAIPGCTASYDWCKVHHVEWWERGGRTDLANLVPLCTAHHRAVHESGWRLTIDPDRRLTVDYPDGTRQTTGPPRRHAA